MWGVPVDHEMFKELNSAQWLWYYNNFLEDKKEKYERFRDMVEYNASFIEPEAVRKIREAREKAVLVSDKDFFTGIKNIFGRDLPATISKNKGKENSEITQVDVAKVLREYKQDKQISKNIGSLVTNCKEWINVNLE
jgi:hypothetical protein